MQHLLFQRNITFGLRHIVNPPLHLLTVQEKANLIEVYSLFGQACTALLYITECVSHVHRSARSQLAKLRTFVTRRGVSPTSRGTSPSRLIVSLNLRCLTTPTSANNQHPLRQPRQQRSSNLNNLCERAFESSGGGNFTGFSISGTQQDLLQCVGGGVSCLPMEGQRSPKKTTDNKRKNSAKRR